MNQTWDYIFVSNETKGKLAFCRGVTLSVEVKEQTVSSRTHNACYLLQETSSLTHMLRWYCVVRRGKLIIKY
jgi:hypothetical protein